MKTTVTIIHPVDPGGVKIGGISSLIRDFIRFAPADFDLRLVGITAGEDPLPSGRWHHCPIGERSVFFFPLHHARGLEKKSPIPLSVLFTLKSVLYRRRIFPNIAGSILHFHRPECALPFLKAREPRVLFSHSDPAGMGSVHSSSRWRTVPEAYFLLEKTVMNKMERIYCVNRDGLAFYRQRLPLLKDKFEFLPTGFNNRVFYRREKPEIRAQKESFCRRYGLPPATRIVLFAGRFVEPKNLPLLLETFRICRGRERDLKLVLIGEGPLEETIRSRANDLGLKGDALFLGRQPPEKIARVANFASVFLLTSAFEGMPVSLLEAMHCGLPAVVSGAGETKNVVGDGSSGRVVSGGGPRELAQAVLEVISRPGQYRPENAVAAAEPYMVEKIFRKVYADQRTIEYG